MKKIVLTALLAAMTVVGSMAQTETTENQTATAQNDPIGKTMSKLWKKTKKGIKNAGTAIGDELTTNSDGDIRVNGVYYMPLYDTNLYGGSDAAELLATCRKLFEEKYPQAVIETCVLPQTDWLSDSVKKDGSIVGYLQSMYCFIIAQDGADGHINAKFLFRSYKEVGNKTLPLKDKWPSWERVDVIPAAAYAKLLKRK